MDSAASVRTLKFYLLVTSLLGLLSTCMLWSFAAAQSDAVPTANWIWSADQTGDNNPAGICYFRKTFIIPDKSQGWIDLACDDRYSLYVNGIKVAVGSGPEKLQRHQLTPYLRSGRNVVAVEAIKNTAGPAGLVATISLRGTRNAIFHMVTNSTWKTNLESNENWQQSEFLDSRWQPARVLSAADDGRIWKTPLAVSANKSQSVLGSKKLERKNIKTDRFRVSPEFRIEGVTSSDETGSLIAMAFDEFGNIIASREQGPLLLIRDMDRDGITETVTTYCDQVKSCQGILAMNGQVMVTGDGPRGAGLYRLSDDDRNGVIDHIDLVIALPTGMQEHGPHALQLGPDGMIYLLLGNLTQLETDFSPQSPYRFAYEGDLVKPRYEDPRGHANSGKAPGGVVLRIDPAGGQIERFAGGLRNPYDMAFNAEGDLFTWDADMEWDQGSTWHRPTRGNHVIPGAEFGWRSGWAKWPEYFIDSLPAFSETGNGSPTGMTVYDHFMFPLRYHGSLFVGDWARGRILAVRIKRQGASYTGEVNVFLEGNPLNVTDMEVGPDGMLYFCTGGRGTEGGVYRVGWTGRVPPQVRDLGTGIEVALRQPQFQTAWARQQIALVKEELTEVWEDELLSIVLDSAADAILRSRAIDLLQLYGPQPTAELLVELSRDRDRRIRRKATYFLGLHPKHAGGRVRLTELLDDPNIVVRRTACESISRIGPDVTPVEKLVNLLGHGDRHLAWAAAKTLQHIPLAAWKDLVLDAKEQRVFLVGGAAILGTIPSKETCLDVFRAANRWTESFIADREFLELLRVMQLALLHGKIKGEDVSDAASQIASEFPSGNTIINRELVRLLAYLESNLVATRYLDYLKSDLPLEDKTHLITHAPFVAKGWTPVEQFEILQLIAELQKDSTSESHTRYLDEAARRFVSKMDKKEHALVLDRGVEWPGAALGTIAFLPKHPDDALLGKLIRLDRALIDQDGEAVSRLRIGIAAVLARSGRDDEMAYLRELFENEPERREILAVALAQQADGANWPLLIRSLSILEDGYAVAVMAKLAASSKVSEEPYVFRHLILQGLSQNQDLGRRLATTLLAKWTGENPAKDAANEKEKVTAWQVWFRANYPDLPDPILPEESALDRYTFDELEEYLDSDDALAATPEAGRLVYAKADCIKCHRFGEIGGGVGPDLSSVGRRFQKKELLQSILYPSHFISDQYATKTVATASGRTFTGVIQGKKDGSVVVLDPEGNEIFVAAEDIDEIVPNKKSTMPAGLLNELSLEDIASLFAFLNQQAQPKVSGKVDREKRER